MVACNFILSDWNRNYQYFIRFSKNTFFFFNLFGINFILRLTEFGLLVTMQVDVQESFMSEKTFSSYKRMSLVLLYKTLIFSKKK